MRLVEAAGCPRSSPAEGKGRLRPGPFRPPHPGSPDDRPDGPESASPITPVPAKDRLALGAHGMQEGLLPQPWGGGTDHLLA